MDLNSSSSPITKPSKILELGDNCMMQEESLSENGDNHAVSSSGYFSGSAAGEEADSDSSDQEEMSLVHPDLYLDSDDLEKTLQALRIHPKNVIEPLEDDTLFSLLDRLEAQWLLADATTDAFHQWCLDRAGLTMDALNDKEIRRLCEIKTAYVKILYIQFNVAGLVGKKPLYRETRTRFSRLFAMVRSVESVLRNLCTVRTLSNASFTQQHHGDVQLYLYKEIDPEDYTPFQELLLFLLNECVSRGYRRYRDRCYQQIIVHTTEGSFPTRAWEPVCDIHEFIHRSVRRDINPEQWKNLTSSYDRNAKSAENYLRSCQDAEFPSLTVDRHRFSFSNGVFDVGTLEWFPFLNSSMAPDEKASCKFHDIIFEDGVYFDEYRNRPEQIPTPLFDKIFNVQKIPKDAMFWIYVFLGRLLFDLGEYDDWEIIPFIKGLAGTGKSTIGKIIKNFYDASDVAVMSPNMEKRFGLSALYDKFMWICYEVTGDWTLPQSVFQSIVSGEEVSVAVKFKTALTLEWVAGGLMFGNEMAKWLDVGNNIGRRVMLIPFDHKVKNSDPTLVRKIVEQESAAILAKIVLCYHTAVHGHGREDIWKVLPRWFIEQNDKLKMQTSPLISFIKSGCCLEKPGAVWWYQDFNRSFGQYCQDYSLPDPKNMTMEKVATILKGENIDTLSHHTGQWDGVTKRGRFIFNLCPAEPVAQKQPSVQGARAPRTVMPFIEEVAA